MERDSVYLLDIVSSARMLRSYLEGVVLDEFLRDTQLQDSVIRRLEIIGEAAGRGFGAVSRQTSKNSLEQYEGDAKLDDSSLRRRGPAYCMEYGAR